MLPIVLPEDEVARINGRASFAKDYTLTVDLVNQTITDDAGLS
jgi:3-isopropylmalate dehydratase small subunit